MSNQDLTLYLVFVVFSILIGSFQYGYHNGELNTPQSVISRCSEVDYVDEDLDCIPMPDSQYALIVSMLTAGGLLGALGSPYFNDRYGRRLTLLGCNIFFGLGSLMATVASTPDMMMIGRFFSGIGSGIVTVVVAPYIAECVPASKRGMFGAFNQLLIVVGIMVAQILGLFWSNFRQWRYILGVGVILAIFQSCILPFCVDSPKYLASIPEGIHDAKESLSKLRGASSEEVEDEILTWDNCMQSRATAEIEEHMPLLQDSTHTTSDSQKVGIWAFLSLPFYRKPLLIVLLMQLSQQLSGINAVIFYSTSIMSTVFPDHSKIITVYISIVNLIMTTVSAALMDKVGRRSLFLTSSCLMATMGTLLGWSIDKEYNTTAAFAIVGFVAAFAIGLGPIPFLMIPEVVETNAVSSACSVGLSVNMISNFIVSAGFLSLRSVLGQTLVFYIFSFTLCLLTLVAVLVLPETKGRSASEVIRSGYSIYP
ncbi:general substrate transporter [Sporodiniella umbellata]|nr:general substrate transporter [Sporodiniella umbellata]